MKMSWQIRHLTNSLVRITFNNWEEVKQFAENLKREIPDLSNFTVHEIKDYAFCSLNEVDKVVFVKNLTSS